MDAYRDLTSVAFSHGPEDVVGQGEFTEVGEDFVADLESRDVGCETNHQRAGS